MTVLIPLVLFFLVLIILSLRKSDTNHRTLFSYFLGEQSLKGFVLAMTLVATYGSVSSFVSGPGLAWHYGLGWVVFAAPQIITGFLILGVLGKKLALVSRRIGAITVIDVIRARFGNAWLARLLAISLLCFFATMMVGQFMGGAFIFSEVAGIDYHLGLLLFAVTVIIYTAFGGFRAVAITDTLCAILMLLGMGLLANAILQNAGGMEAVMAQVAASDEAARLLSPNAQGALPYPLLFSAWILVGFATVALPQSAIRCMAYRESKDLHCAMLVGTVVCGALMIGMTFIGFLIRGLPLSAETFGGNTDVLIPYIIAHHMDPWVAGLTLVAPLAATMSTVSSLLIMASSAVIKDLLLHDCPSFVKTEAQLHSVSRWVTAGLGVVALLLALFPLELIAWINMFAFGGLEIAFLCPLVGGVFWRRANAKAALASVVSGLGAYLLLGVSGLRLFDTHAVVPALALSLLVFVWISMKEPIAENKDFFP